MKIDYAHSENAARRAVLALTGYVATINGLQDVEVCNVLDVNGEPCLIGVRMQDGKHTALEPNVTLRLALIETMVL